MGLKASLTWVQLLHFCCCSITLTVGHKTIQRILTLTVQLQSCALVHARYRVLWITSALGCLHELQVESYAFGMFVLFTVCLHVVQIFLGLFAVH